MQRLAHYIVHRVYALHHCTMFLSWFTAEYWAVAPSERSERPRRTARGDEAARE